LEDEEATPLALNRGCVTRDFKLQVIREIEAGKPVTQAAREHQLHPTLLRRWQREYQQYTDDAFMGNGYL
jgi:transposase